MSSGDEAGGLGVIEQMVKPLGLTESINRICPIFKMTLPYSEADHGLNIAYNLLAWENFNHPTNTSNVSRH